MVKLLWGPLWQFPRRLNTELPRDPARISIAKGKYRSTQKHTRMFIATPFIITKNWRRPTWASIDE